MRTGPAAGLPAWARRALDRDGQEDLPAPLGAHYLGGGRCRFVVWAPRVERLDLVLRGAEARTVPMERAARGYRHVEVDGVEPGVRYAFRLDGERERPDPASRFQPEGVHGPSEVVDPDHPWEDGGWKGVALADHILYELHVGTFTQEGSFAAAAERLPELAELGVTAVELLPVAQFPGARNWGYDGVHPFAVQASYGGPAGLRRFVDACHRAGLAVVLDVVYNHLGPEGAYQHEYGPYFTEAYSTPWGRALNFDRPGSDEVRRYFVENALHWVGAYHVDGLRLDATDRILDTSARPFLRELAEAVHALGGDLDRRVHLFPEDDRNAPILIRRPREGGYGLDAEWADDFHHALHALLTGERTGYYADFGRAEDLAEAFRHGWTYRGRWSEHRARTQGDDTAGIPGRRFVVFSQNHDQVGNRADPRRLRELASPAAARLAAAAVLLSPFLPLLFMGEEWGDPAPFPYFTDHGDPELAEAVRRGRREEFAAFRWSEPPPDPQAESTFRSAVLDHGLKRSGEHAATLAYYRALIRLRREVPALARPGRRRTEVRRDGEALVVLRRDAASRAAVLLNVGPEPRRLAAEIPAGRWSRRLDSGDREWGGPGPELPERLVSEGRAEVRIPGLTAGVYVRDR